MPQPPTSLSLLLPRHSPLPAPKPSPLETPLTTTEDRTNRRSELIVHLESIHKDFMTATNERDLQLHSPIWRHLSPSVGLELSAEPLPDGTSADAYSEQSRLPEFFDGPQGLMLKFPMMRFECLSQTTVIYGKGNGARTTAYMQLSGNRTGIKTDFILIVDWKALEGTWQVCNMKSFQGLDLLGFVDGL